VRPEVRDWLEEIACRAGLSALPKPGVLAAAAVCLVLLGIGAWRWLAGPVGVKPLSAATQAPAAGARSSGTAAGDSAETTESAQVTVHVVGAVRTPGVYALRKGSRAADAVEAAGGLLGNAAPSALNLARVVQDGEQVVVPTADEAATGAAAAGGAGSAAAAGAGGAGAGGKVNLNTATAEQLDALPGVGPSTAAKIVADREQNGPFRSPDDLMRVTGIGAKKFASLKDLISVK
jgi:competence protein ComEA